MVSSFFISIVVLSLLWVTFATPTIVTSQSSSLESEKEGLLKTRWWNTTYTNNVNMSSPCNWLGIACDDGGSVTNIDLPGNELKGSIPQEIGTFSKLTPLNLSYNYLTGEIPISLATLNQLVTLDLSFNKLTGPIPATLGYPSHNGNLTIVDLSHNNLTSKIPQSLISTSYINLSYNSLRGPIPYGFESPEAFIGKKDLCGTINGFHPCPTSQILVIVFIFSIDIGISLAVIFFGYFFL